MAHNELISSRQNPLVKELQAIRDDRQSPWMFLEGPRLVEEVTRSHQPVEILVWTTAAEADPVVSAVQAKAKRLCRVANTVFEAVSDVKSPQGVLAIVKRPVWQWDDLLRKTPLPILILDGVQDPGNMATILRTAEAAGAAGIVTTEGTARLFSPKALRGAMGSTLRLPILEHQELEGISRELTKAGYALVGTASQTLEGSVISYSQFDWTRPSALILGHEGQGLSKSWSRHITSVVHIPMQSPVESLNVAAAAAVLLYESRRQRA
jgi:TrmH family RNA methyltransferase